MAIAVAAVLLAWRIVAWAVKRLESSLSSLNEKVDKLEKDLGDLSNNVYELKGEVKGRTYSEMEQLVRTLKPGRD